MSLSNVNLRKQIGGWLGFGKSLSDITQRDIDQKTKKCEELFETLHLCVQRHGWNDNHCQTTIKPKYERCILKRVRESIKRFVGQNEECSAREPRG